MYQREDQLGLSELYHTAAQFSAVLLGSAAAFLVVYGGVVLNLWTRDPQLSAGLLILQILVIGMLINGLMSAPDYLQMAAGWTGLLARTNVVMVVVFVPIVYVLTVTAGGIGAAVAWVLINCRIPRHDDTIMHRRLLPGEAAEWFLRDALLPVAAAVIVAVTLRPFAPSADGLLLLPFLALALVGTLAASSLAANRVRRELLPLTRPPSSTSLSWAASSGAAKQIMGCKPERCM